MQINFWGCSYIKTGRICADLLHVEMCLVSPECKPDFGIFPIRLETHRVSGE